MNELNSSGSINSSRTWLPLRSCPVPDPVQCSISGPLQLWVGMPPPPTSARASHGGPVGSVDLLQTDRETDTGRFVLPTFPGETRRSHTELLNYRPHPNTSLWQHHNSQHALQRFTFDSKLRETLAAAQRVQVSAGRSVQLQPPGVTEKCLILSARLIKNMDELNLHFGGGAWPGNSSPFLTILGESFFLTTFLRYFQSRIKQVRFLSSGIPQGDALGTLKIHVVHLKSGEQRIDYWDKDIIS